MNLIVHAEVEGGEAQNVYEGDSVEEAKDFLEGLDKVTVLQVNFSGEKNGEKRALARSAKNSEDSDAADSLKSDALSWLEENGE
jgi:hypothetical protein